MNAVPHERGLALLAAQCASFDQDASKAREQLDEALGPELAHKLVFALSTDAGLRAGPSFAA